MVLSVIDPLLVTPELADVRSSRGKRSTLALAAEHVRDEDTSRLVLYSITSSALASSVGGNSRPSAFAVLRLVTSSNVVGCWTGKSDGLIHRNQSRSTP